MLYINKVKSYAQIQVHFSTKEKKADNLKDLLKKKTPY